MQDGRGEYHRLALHPEAGAQREGPGAAAPVLEDDDVHPAGLLDAYDGAHPAGLDLFDHEPVLGGHGLRRRPTPPPLRARKLGGQHVGSIPFVNHGLTLVPPPR